jgi:hypothetical protein
MKINSKEASAVLEQNKYVVFRNYLTPPEGFLFDKAYGPKSEVLDESGSDYGPMRMMPEYFFENKNVSDFYDECSSLYGVKTTPLLIEGNVYGKGTDRHSDLSDVLHWQCSGKSEWTFYDNPQNGSTTKVLLASGDIIWFKKDQDHSVENLDTKRSIIFMSTNILKDFLVKKYAEVGREFK